MRPWIELKPLILAAASACPDWQMHRIGAAIKLYEHSMALNCDSVGTAVERLRAFEDLRTALRGTVASE